MSLHILTSSPIRQSCFFITIGRSAGQVNNPNKGKNAGEVGQLHAGIRSLDARDRSMLGHLSPLSI